MTARRSLIADALDIIAPGLPAFERADILDHAVDSKGLRKASPQSAAWAALVAFARHACTDYDSLLAEGYDVASARHFVLPAINRQLAEWGCRRRVSETEEA